jgi:hypothetical protein
MNGYKFDFAVSAKISPKVVEEMIKRVVEEQTGKTVKSIKLEMRSVTKGNQRDEYTETIFDGATVIFENEQSVTQGRKVFTQDSYDPHAR